MIVKYLISHIGRKCDDHVEDKNHKHGVISEENEKVEQGDVDYIDDEAIEDEEAMPEEIKEMTHDQQQK